MADNDDKHEDGSGAHKKTLTLKGGPGIGARPGMSRSSRTVVVEKRTRIVPQRGAGDGRSGAPAPRPHPTNEQQKAAPPAPRQPLRQNSQVSRPPARPVGGLSAAEAAARDRVL